LCSSLPLFSSYLVNDNFTFLFQLFEVVVKTFFINGSECRSRNLQLNPFVQFGNEKTFFLQVWKESSLGFTIRVRNFIPGHGSFTCQITKTCHFLYGFSKRSAKMDFFY